MSVERWVLNYAAVRFMPHRETAEFVNVGVVAACPEIDFFDFKLMPRRAARVRKFFPEVDRDIFEKSLAAIDVDFKTRRNIGKLLTEGCEDLSTASARAKVEEFTSLMRRRESILHFSEPRTCLTDDPQAKVKDLYDRLVNRSFAKTPEYSEEVMQRRLNDHLREWKLRKLYKLNKKIGDHDFHVMLPFVAFGASQRAEQAIKPLNLDRSEPTTIYTHGDEWVVRFRRLKKRSMLPARMIVPIVRPEADVSRIKAADDIGKSLSEIGVDVVDFNDLTRLHELAKFVA